MSNKFEVMNPPPEGAKDEVRHKKRLSKLSSAKDFLKILAQISARINCGDLGFCFSWIVFHDGK
jgi:hypothetical protein